MNDTKLIQLREILDAASVADKGTELHSNLCDWLEGAEDAADEQPASACC